MTDATKPVVEIEFPAELSPADMNDLCEAAAEAIKAGGGFGWVSPPSRAVLETYWRGVLLVPERYLFLGRLDGVIGGSAQLAHPTRNNEAQAHAAILTTSFVAPWARGHGVARGLVTAVEARARDEGFMVLNLDVRATQVAAIALYERLGYMRWGAHPHYARVKGKWVAGYFYSKDLKPTRRRGSGAES